MQYARLAKLISRRVSGRALYLAVVISFISAVLALLFILSRYYGYVEYTLLDKKAQLSDQLNSAITVAIQPQSTVPYNKQESFQPEEEDNNQCSIVKSPWGVYSVVRAKASWKHLAEEKIGLYGYRIAKDKPIGLYLADQGHYLAVSGDSYVSGACYLPALGARKAYIDGQSFKYSEIIHGSIHKSTKELPALPDDVRQYLSDQLFNPFQSKDSIVSIDYLRKSKYHNSFKNTTIRISDEEEIELDRITISGNYIIQSDKKIWIDNSATLKNIICVAPIIEVEKDFSGVVQLISSDSVVIGKNVSLQYPSAIVCTGKNKSSAHIIIQERAIISGTVLLYSDLNLGKDTYMQLQTESLIYGLVYCAGDFEHRGKVTGSLYCNKLVLQTQRGYYENHILDAWIDPMNLEPQFISCSFLIHNDFLNEGGIVQWLN